MGYIVAVAGVLIKDTGPLGQPEMLMVACLSPAQNSEIGGNGVLLGICDDGGGCSRAGLRMRNLEASWSTTPEG